MAWIKLVPANSGGGRKPTQLAARLNDSGQFSITHAVAELLVNPDRVLVEIDPDAQSIRLTPTTPGSKGAFALSGGGNASYRFTMREAMAKYPQMVGEYQPRKQAGAVLFTKLQDE